MQYHDEGCVSTSVGKIVSWSSIQDVVPPWLSIMCVGGKSNKNRKGLSSQVSAFTQKHCVAAMHSGLLRQEWVSKLASVWGWERFLQVLNNNPKRCSSLLPSGRIFFSLLICCTICWHSLSVFNLIYVSVHYSLQRDNWTLLMKHQKNQVLHQTKRRRLHLRYITTDWY